ncbi:MAG: 3-oxoacyl-[acyl-carrier-protein] synthase III C-terminal domain-containing protein [Elusimicrobiota bacterium]
MKAAPAAYFHDFRPLPVGAPLSQNEVISWLKRALARTRGGRLAPQDRRALTLYDRLGRGGSIEKRASALADYGRRDWRRMELFRDRAGQRWFKPTLQARMAVYEDKVLKLASRAFPAGERAPDYAVQVSCTGYASPHALQRVVARRGWDSRFLHIGHMGCYASVPAAAMAANLVRGEAASGNPAARAALFFAELCTLHLKPGANADGQVVVNTLFADGAIRFDVSAKPRTRSLELLVSREEILPGSERDMTWRLEDSAFDMGLTRAVPALISGAVGGFVTRTLKNAGVGFSEISHFAIHPGGPRVIDSVLRALGLPPEASRHSRDLLRRRGNMSSATLPHVWGEMLDDPAVRHGDLILSLAFGPGLTMAANILRKRR